jgi:hypothetical protein
MADEHVTAKGPKRWSRLRAVIRATCRDTPIAKIEEVLVQRLRAEFDERDASRFPEPTDDHHARAEARLRELGL